MKIAGCHGRQRELAAQANQPDEQGRAQPAFDQRGADNGGCCTRGQQAQAQRHGRQPWHAPLVQSPALARLAIALFQVRLEESLQRTFEFRLPAGRMLLTGA
jgi:hypothetical protein